jgi:prepilin-type N-terminal cleavage/methylation domain-containing protein
VARPPALPFASRPAFTLIELLLVLALMSVFTAVALTNMQPTAAENLEAAAGIVAADLAYARSLAVGNDSRYQVEFNGALEQYVLEHTGDVAAFDVLPRSPTAVAGEPPTRRTQRLADLPLAGLRVEVVGVEQIDASSEIAATAEIEFGPLGEMTASRDRTVWLSSGTGAARRYVSIRVAKVTGLADVGPLQATAPAAVEVPQLDP